MSLFNVPLPLRSCMLAFCLVAAPLAEAGAGDMPRPAPMVLAQADPDVVQDDGQGGDAAAFLVRITRLEDRLRSLTGQVEQLQFQNKRLEDQLRKMQADVDFRFQDLQRAPASGGRAVPAKRTDAADPAGDGPALVDAGPPAVQPVVADAPRAARRSGDAFDPQSNPGAPGVPRPLGTTTPSQPLPAGGGLTSGQTPPVPSVASAPHAPLDLTPNSLAPTQRPVPAAAPSVQEAAISPDVGLRSSSSSAGAGSAGSTRSEFDNTVTFYKSGQFDAAIDGFQNFVQRYPKDRLVPDATYFLGESYARQGRQREAAEQFLKLSTDYAKSSRAPDALLRLGIALNALGAREQACATYQEVDRKYPAAASDVRAGVERELKRAKC